MADASGLHPILFSWREGEVVAGERAAEVGSGHSGVELNAGSIACHLNGLPLPRDATFFRGVRTVAPGFLVKVDRDGVRFGRSWRLEARPMTRWTSDLECASALRSLVTEVVADQARGDRIAVTVSGGMDSTSVAAALCTTRDVRSLTALTWVAPGFEAADESRAARAVCECLGLTMTPLRLDLLSPLSGPDGIRPGPSSPLCLHYEEVWRATLKAAADAGCGVVLGGHPGDCLFGGMVPAYTDLLLTGRWADLVNQVRTQVRTYSWPVGTVAWRQVLRPLFWWLAVQMGLRRRSRVPWLGPALRRAPLVSSAAADVRAALLPGRLMRLIAISDWFAAEASRRVREIAREEGTELREPLFDPRVLTFAARLPSWQTYRAGIQKFVQRNAFRGILPAEVVESRRKVRPTSVWSAAMRVHQRPKVDDLVTSMRAHELGYVDQHRLRAHFDRFARGETVDTRFWHALTFEAWLRRYG